MYHKLEPRLYNLIIETSRKPGEKYGQKLIDAIERQAATKREKDELLMEKKLDDKGGNFVKNLFLHDKYSSEQCWKTIKEANEQFNAIKSKARKLRAVKDQITIRYPGLGQVEAYRAWCKYGVDYTPAYLFKFFIQVVLPLLAEKKVPPEPPVDLPAPPDILSFGTYACDATGLSESHKERVQ